MGAIMGPNGKPVGAGPVVQGSYSDVFTINPTATQRLAAWPAGQAPTSTSTVNEPTRSRSLNAR
jgi:hypothetical protein